MKTLTEYLAEAEENHGHMCPGQALGVRLFERDKRRVLLTPAGELVVRTARRVLSEVDELRLSSRTLCRPLAGTLRLGVIPTITSSRRGP